MSDEASDEAEQVFVAREGFVAQRLHQHALETAGRNLPALCRLEPKDFCEQVIQAGVAVDDGDWVQPVFRRKDGTWQLHQLEVLFRLSDAFGVPFPAFVNFVRAASDQCPEPDPELRQAFRRHAVDSLRRVDARLSQLPESQRLAIAQAGVLTNLNFTAKQLEAVLSVPLANHRLLCLEETEYDAAPENISMVRHEVWQRMGGLSLDDVKPTLADVAAYADGPLDYEPPTVPSSGAPYKPLCASYAHDFTFTRRFIEDFRRARKDNPAARGDVKLDEEFCCYLIGTGHAPFARETMARWSEEHPVASRALRAAGLAIVREALAAGMGIVLEVSFEDSEVQWLVDEVPELESRLFKQGGRSGSTALPHSLLGSALLSCARGEGARAPHASQRSTEP